MGVWGRGRLVGTAAWAFSAGHWQFVVSAAKRDHPLAEPSLVVAGRVMCQLAGKTERLRGLGRDFVERNTAKAIAIGAGLLWNFFGYKYFVFE